VVLLLLLAIDVIFVREHNIACHEFIIRPTVVCDSLC